MIVVYNNRNYFGLEATNKVFLRFKSACSATVTSWKIKISLEANSDMMLSKSTGGKPRNCHEIVLT